MEVFDFGPRTVRLKTSVARRADLFESLRYIGHSGLAVTFGENAPAYDDGAIVPTFVSDEDATPFLRSVDISPKNQPIWCCKVYLAKYVAALYDLGILSESDVPNVEQNSKIGEWARQLIVPFFEDVFGKDAEFTLAGATLDLPNQRTTSINRSTGRRVGLHIDTFRMMPIKDRVQEKFRCVVNIGRQPRWFIFDPRCAADIIGSENSGMFPDETGSFSPTRTLRKKSETSPLTLFSLKLNPGEGYIAPTEVIPHDASTYRLRSYGAMYTLRGFFNEGEFSKLNAAMA